MRLSVAVLIAIHLAGCVVVPETKSENNYHCEISSDKKTLKIVNLADKTNSFFTIENMVMSPITVLTTGIVSASYVAVNNIYYLGEKEIKCRGAESKS
jgi:TATA-box binding protein (TBP) (component of TFIID and TFIIIB)